MTVGVACLEGLDAIVYAWVGTGQGPQNSGTLGQMGGWAYPWVLFAKWCGSSARCT